MPKYANKTVNYNIYGKITGKMKLIGETTNCQLPSLDYQTDSLKGAGIMGEIDMPSPSPGSMAFSAGIRVSTADSASLGAPTVQELEVRWVTDQLDSSKMKIGTDAHKAVVKGIPKKFDPGKVEAGAAQDGSIEIEVLYYKETINGKTVIEVDKLNGKLIINGTDYYKAIADNL